MNTLQLKYFMEFVHHGSAEKAAMQLGVSRSSINRNIKKLEEEMGTKLFYSGNHGIVLTGEGDICLKYARQILKINDNLRFDIVGDGMYHGKIEIAMGTSRSQEILSFVLPEFNRRYPYVQVQIHELCTSEIYNWLLEQRLDFAIVSRKDISYGFDYEYLLTEHLVLVAPRDDAYVRDCAYRKNGKMYVNLNDFQDKSFILGYGGQKSRMMSDRLFRKLNFEPRIILQTSNTFNAAMLAYNGLAYTLVPESSATREKNYMIHYHLEPETEVGWVIGIASLKKNPISHVAVQLKTMICEMLGDNFSELA